MQLIVKLSQNESSDARQILTHQVSRMHCAVTSMVDDML